MNNETLLKKGIEMLQEIDSAQLENVEVETFKHDDGTINFSVSVTSLGIQQDYRQG